MVEFNFNPFPVLQTERLNLRQITLADAGDFFALRTNKEATKYINKPLHKTVSETEELIKKVELGIQANETISWAITLKENPKLIGSVSYHKTNRANYRAEIGYMILPEHWNKGFVSEAVKVVLDYGFKRMNLHSIEANINPNNLVSAKLLKKFGFIKEAYFKENYFYNGKFLDTEIYSLLKSSTI